MSPQPRNRSRPTTRATPIGAKATTPSTAARDRALANSIAAGQIRKNADHTVDWEPVLERFKAMMAGLYADGADE